MRGATWVAACAAVVLVAATCVGGGDGDSRSAFVSHQDETFGWSIAYPDDWHLDASHVVSRVTIWETTIANFDATSDLVQVVDRHRGFLRTRLRRDDRVSDFPHEGVAVRIFRRDGGPAPDFDMEEANFPLSLRDFERRRHAFLDVGGVRSSAPRPFLHPFGANGWDFYAAAWIGAEASAADRALLERVVRSLRFPPLQEGSVAASERFDVLGRAMEYPVASATRILRGTGFYLVRAPGGFYALRGYCQDDSRFGLVEFDRRTFEFSCPDGRRWNRTGASLDWGEPLQVLPAKVAHDGHVLVARGVYTSLSRQMRARFWPR